MLSTNSVLTIKLYAPTLGIMNVLHISVMSILIEVIVLSAYNPLQMYKFQKRIFSRIMNSPRTYFESSLFTNW